MTETTGNFLRGMGLVNAAGTGINTANRTHQARDAIVYFDGERLERESNRFEIDGLTININANINPNATPPDNPVDLRINIIRDTSDTMDMIRNFVEEYNNLVRSIRELTETRRPRQPGGGGHFMPLTEEQRRGMSEREVELWEEQARTGILHRDSTLRDLTNRMHREIFRNVYTEDGRTLNLLHFGIRTSSDLTRFGELQIDEARLEHALANRTDDVAALFTQRSDTPPGTIIGNGHPNDPGIRRQRQERLNESGVAQRLNDILMWETMGGGGIHGTAGTVSQEADNSTMSRRITQADRRIETILADLQRREQRYFEKFSRLEAAMMQSQSQMMWLDQMIFAGMQ
jgi:flagellar hook-associated protein 2